MSTMPSQLFAQNLSQGMDTALRIKQMQQQRAIEQARQAFDLMQFEAQQQQQQIANQLRQSELDRLIENDTYRQGVDVLNRFERDQAIRQEQEAAQALFSDLLGQRTESDEMTRMQSGGMGPPVGAESVAVDDPRAVQFARASPFMQKLMAQEHINTIKQREKDVYGRSQLEKIDREIRVIQDDLESGLHPKDSANYHRQYSRLIELQNTKDRLVFGTSANAMPSAVLASIHRAEGLPGTNQRDPNMTAAIFGQRAKIEGELEMWRSLRPGESGDYIVPNFQTGNEMSFTKDQVKARIKSLERQLQALSPMAGTAPAMGAGAPPVEPIESVDEVDEFGTDIDALYQEYTAPQ